MDSKKGSKIAKDGFQNEKDVVNKFNGWQNNRDAQDWLKIMGYELKDIEYVKAILMHGYKTDVQVHITIKLTDLIDAQNIQIKLVSNPKGFNQIDKRWVDSYAKLWSIPKDIVNLLKYFTGEIKPVIKNSKDPRRMFLNEFNKESQTKILNFFKKK